MGILGAAHQPDHRILRHLDAGNGSVVHLHDPVTRQDADLFGRSAGNHVAYHGRIFRHRELDADAEEFAHQRFVGALEILGGEIDRMGIELCENQRQNLLGDLGGIEGIHIVGGDVVQDHRQLVPALPFGRGLFGRYDRRAAGHPPLAKPQGLDQDGQAYD